MSTVVSSLSVVIGADTSGFTRGADQVQNKISSFGATASGAMVSVGRATTNFGNSISNTGSQIEGLAQPFVSIAADGLDAASSFQDVMTNLQVFGGLSGDQLEEVRQKALQLGADTKFSASDAAGGMLELVKSGMSVSDAMTAMTGTMDLAAAGQISLDQASGIIVTTLAQFGMGADQAGEAANVLAAAALASRADVSTLADGLKNVGPVASAAGLSLEDTAASLAVLANAGIDGAEAGTQLKSLLLNFNSDAAKKQFADLGVSLYDASGNTRDFDTVLDELKVSLDAMTPEERATAMKNLAGSYGVTALNALLAQDGIDGMKTAMDGAPSAADLAAKGMGTFSGKVESLKGSVETLMITGLTPLMENVLTPLAEQLTGVVNSVTDWAAANPEAASTIGGLVLALGVLGPALVVIGSAVSLMGMAFSGLGVVVGVVTSPIGLLALAIGGLVAIVNDPTIQAGLAAWQGVFDMLPDVINLAATAVTDFVNSITAASVGDAVVGVVNSILSLLGIDITIPDFPTIVQGFQDGFQSIKDTVSAIADDIMAKLNGFIGGIKNFVIDFETTILQLQVIGAQAMIDMGQGANLLGIDVAGQTATRDAALAQIENLNAQRYVPTTVPHFAGGGDMANDGLAYLHAGEKVLTPSQADSYNSGRGGSGGHTFIINQTQSTDDIVNEIVRKGGPNLYELRPT